MPISLANTHARSRIVGVAHYLPAEAVSNSDLIRCYKIDSSDEWITSRTGIKQRHFVQNGEKTGDLAFAAATRVLTATGYAATDIDLVIVATTTPDNIFPATAAAVAARLGIKKDAPAFDVQAVCAGFVFAAATADNMIKLGQAERALVIGAETFSRLLDWRDRSTCVLFGDGAGAMLIEASSDPIQNGTSAGIIDHRLYSDGSYYDSLLVAPKYHNEPDREYLMMHGKTVFRHAVDKMSGCITDLTDKHGITPDDLDRIVPHQANERIIEAMLKKMQLDSDVCISTIDRHANISAASIPVAMSLAFQENKLQPGMLVALTALGGGFAWGGMLLRL